MIVNKQNFHSKKAGLIGSVNIRKSDQKFRSLQSFLSEKFNFPICCIRIWRHNKTISESDKILIRQGENIRIILQNNSMMRHPMHLHGLWMELENGHGNRSPRIHTINVKPAERVSLLVTADASMWLTAASTVQACL